MGKLEPQAPQGRLNNQDWRKMLAGAYEWSKPLLAIYVLYLAGVFMSGKVTFQALLPNEFVWGAMAKWVGDRLFDLYKKLTDGPKV